MAQGSAEKRMIPGVPGGFDEDASQMRVAGFGDVAARLFGAAGGLGRDETGERHDARGRREAARIAQFSGDRQRREIVDTAEAAQALNAGSQRVDREQIAQLGIDRLEPCDAFVDGADVGAMGLLERGEWPALGLEPLGVAFGPGFLRRGKPAAVTQEEF